MQPRCVLTFGYSGWECVWHHKRFTMSEFGKEHGLIHEVIVTGREVGADKDFWATLAHDKNLFEQVVNFVNTTPAPIFRLVDKFDNDKTKDGWTSMSDTELNDGQFQPELVEFLKDGEDYVNGDEMVKRTEHEANGGQRAAEAMLRDQSKIPQAWRKHILVFPKTLWRDSDRCQRVPYLYWDDGEWCLLFDWLGNDFDGLYRVVRLGKYQK